MLDFVMYLPLGVIAGGLAGLFGIGGGIVIVPVLLVAFEIFQMEHDLLVHLAVGTSLACVVPTALSSLLAHHKKEGVIWPWVIRLTPFLVVGGLLGGYTADQLPGDVLTIILGTFLMAMAFQLFLRNRHYVDVAELKTPSMGAFGIFGLLLGWCSAMVGIAGGALAIPFFASYGSGMRRAVGTAAAVGLPTAAAGAVSFVIAGLDNPGRPELSIGYVYVPAFLGVVLTSTVAARFGARLAHRLDQTLLRRLFACFLAALSIRLIWNTVA